MDINFPATPLSADALECLARGRRRSDSFRQITADLLKAQNEFGPILKTRTATETSRDPDTGVSTARTWLYADLVDILAVVRPALNKYGMVLTQDTMRLPDLGFCMVSELLHAPSGEWLASYLPMPDITALTESRADPQEIAGFLTLWRRYSACPLLGIAAEEADKAGKHVEASKAEAAGRRKRATAQPEIAPADKPTPAAAPADAAPDYADSTTRALALKDLTEAILLHAKGEAPNPWPAAAAVLAKARPIEIELMVDAFRKEVGSEPPPVDGVSYPPRPAA